MKNWLLMLVSMAFMYHQYIGTWKVDQEIPLLWWSEPLFPLLFCIVGKRWKSLIRNLMRVFLYLMVKLTYSYNWVDMIFAFQRQMVTCFCSKFLTLLWAVSKLQIWDVTSFSSWGMTKNGSMMCLSWSFIAFWYEIICIIYATRILLVFLPIVAQLYILVETLPQ